MFRLDVRPLVWLLSTAARAEKLLQQHPGLCPNCALLPGAHPLEVRLRGRPRRDETRRRTALFAQHLAGGAGLVQAARLAGVNGQRALRLLDDPAFVGRVAELKKLAHDDPPSRARLAAA